MQAAAIRAPAVPGAVLYVEDDALVSLATVDVLENAGYAIYAAPGCRAGAGPARHAPGAGAHGHRHRTAGMNGHDLAAEARRRRPHLKVLFLTGHDRTRVIGEPADLRTRYLDKPYLDSDLFEALRGLSERERDRRRGAGLNGSGRLGEAHSRRTPAPPPGLTALGRGYRSGRPPVDRRSGGARKGRECGSRPTATTSSATSNAPIAGSWFTAKASPASATARPHLLLALVRRVGAPARR